MVPFVSHVPWGPCCSFVQVRSVCSPYFGEAKKGKSPAAATERHQDSAKNQVRNSTQGFDRLSPILRYLRTNGARLRQAQPERGWGRKRARNSGAGVFGVGAQIPRACGSPCGCCASLHSEIVIRPQKPGSADIALHSKAKLRPNPKNQTQTTPCQSLPIQ